VRGEYTPNLLTDDGGIDTGGQPHPDTGGIGLATVQIGAFHARQAEQVVA
jgi:hypothetical protein